MALPVAVLVQLVTGGWPNLSNSLLVLMGWQVDPSALERYAVQLLAHVGLPTLAVFLVLRLTRLGGWLVPNRLALASLLAADAILSGLALRGLALTAMDERPFLYGLSSQVVTGALLASLIAGLGVLLLSTLWHRVVKDKDQALTWWKSWLREV
jgi:hypothetical protein